MEVGLPFKVPQETGVRRKQQGNGGEKNNKAGLKVQEKKGEEGKRGRGGKREKGRKKRKRERQGKRERQRKRETEKEKKRERERKKEGKKGMEKLHLGNAQWHQSN